MPPMKFHAIASTPYMSTVVPRRSQYASPAIGSSATTPNKTAAMRMLFLMCSPSGP